MITLYQLAFTIARSLVIDGKTTPDDPDASNPLHGHNQEGCPMPSLGSPRYRAAPVRKPPNRRRQQATRCTQGKP
jgi:hypothetical protein